MKKKTLVMYDLKGKSQVEKVQILRKLFGYRDKSNYNYEYARNGKLANVKLKRYKKSVIELEDPKDLALVIETFNELNVKADLAELQ